MHLAYISLLLKKILLRSKVRNVMPSYFSFTDFDKRQTRTVLIKKIVFTKTIRAFTLSSDDRCFDGDAPPRSKHPIPSDHVYMVNKDLNGRMEINFILTYTINKRPRRVWAFNEFFVYEKKTPKNIIIVI